LEGPRGGQTLEPRSGRVEPSGPGRREAGDRPRGGQFGALRRVPVEGPGLGAQVEPTRDLFHDGGSH